jgi:hypothetical protein
MYRDVLSEAATARGWPVHVYDAEQVLGQAAGRLAERADEVLSGPPGHAGPAVGE